MPETTSRPMKVPYCDPGLYLGYGAGSVCGTPVPAPQIKPVRADSTRRCPMANIKSQIKRNRQSEKARLRNKAVRSEMKTRTKRAFAAAESGAENTAEVAREAVKRIDTAATKGVIHKNTAARRKSRLMKRVAASQSAE